MLFNFTSVKEVDFFRLVLGYLDLHVLYYDMVIDIIQDIYLILMKN